VANVAIADLALGGVTRITRRVRFDTRWDRLTASRGLVTGCAAVRGAAFPGCMRSVVKLHIEAFFELGRKCSLRRENGLKIFVANGAHHLIVPSDELIQMAANTRFMTLLLYLLRAALALMTSVTGKFRMFGDFMRKSLEGPVRRALRDQWGSFNSGKRYG
jgi:hypothetical protein